MAQYKIGTISITSGTNVVTGVGTLFLANVSVGDSFKVTGVNALYGVIAVDSNTQIRISPNYAGTTVVAGQYQVTSDFTANLGLAEISAGDSEVAFHLTHEVIRKLDTAVAGKCAAVGPGSSQAFSVGALTAAGGVLSSSGTQGVHLSSSENSINYGYGQNADALTYINLYGYQNGVTRYRSLEVRDGKAGLIAHFDGPTGRVFVGSGVDNGSGAKLQVSGNASIETSAGSTILDVGSNIGANNATILRLKNGTGVKGWLVGSQYNAGGFEITPSTVVGGSTYSTPAVFITHVGNVLVSTATDNGSGAKLQVNGGITAKTYTITTGANAQVVADASVDSFPQFMLKENGVTKWNIYNEYTNDYLSFGNGTLAVAALTQTGTFLVNTATDNGSGAKLQVNGGISVTAGLTSLNTNMLFYAGGAERFRIQTNGALVVVLPSYASVAAAVSAGEVAGTLIRVGTAVHTVA